MARKAAGEPKADAGVVAQLPGTDLFVPATAAALAGSRVEVCVETARGKVSVRAPDAATAERLVRTFWEQCLEPKPGAGEPVFWKQCCESKLAAGEPVTITVTNEGGSG